MKAAEKSAVRSSSTITASSLPGCSSPGGTIGSRSEGSFGRRRPMPSSVSETSRSLALAMARQPLADHHADRDERERRDEPRDQALGHGAEMTDRPAAAVVRVLRVLDVPDDRVELPVGDLLLR